jgi:hypothetical protein
MRPQITCGRILFWAFEAVAENKMVHNTVQSGVEETGRVSPKLSERSSTSTPAGKASPAVEKSAKGARKRLISNKNGERK